MSQVSKKTLPTLLALGSAFPSHTLTQEELFEGLYRKAYRDIPNAENIFRQAQVQRRRFAWDPRQALAHSSPGTGDRVRSAEGTFLEVAGETLKQVLPKVDRDRIGSFAMASCTMYTGPTPELQLARLHGLRSSVRRTYVGHMGCFAAFNVIKVALDSLAARPDEHVLVNCTEFNSIHFRTDATQEQVVIHSLFGDASSSMVLGSAPEGEGLQFLATHTEQIYEAHELMTWSVHNDGFYMTLSPYVPFLIHEHLDPYLERLLGPTGVKVGDVKHWLIHPGGPKILELIAKQLGLADSRMRASWQILHEYGNCASTTIMLVLEEALKVDKPQRGEYGVMMAFGPGLTLEGALVRF